MSTKFHSLVFVLTTDEPLQIPASLSELKISPERPILITGLDLSILDLQPKAKRRRKSEMPPSTAVLEPLLKSLIAFIILTNIKGDQFQRERTRKLAIDGNDTNSNYKPCLLYIHITATTTKEFPVKQTFPYVEYAFNLLCEHEWVS